jgi:hypothetical protein
MRRASRSQRSDLRQGLSSADVPHRLLAGLVALVANFSANTAVLVLPRVALALLSAHLAGGGAELKHLPQDLFIGAGAPRRERAGGSTYIGTVEVEPDALLELLDHLLGEAGIGARGTGLGAGVTFIDAADQGLADAASHIGVGADYVSCMHGDLRRGEDLDASSVERSAVTATDRALLCSRASPRKGNQLSW